MQSTTLSVFILLTISLAILSCKNKPSTSVEETQAAAANETIQAVIGERINNSENGPYTLYKASALKPSDYAKKLKELVFYDNSEVEEASETSGGDILKKLYPLGWSKDGNFAFAEYSVDYHEEHVITYTIKNMASGDKLWNKELVFEMIQDTTEYYSEAEAEMFILTNGNESEDDLFKYAWTVTEKMVMEALNGAGIVFNPATPLLKQTNYQDLSFAIEKIQSEDEDYEVEYLLKSNKHGSKVIFKDNWDAYQPKIVGVIESPFSQVIAVICSQKQQYLEMTDGIEPIITGYALD